MRITLITQYYPPERGAVRYGHRLARALATAGHSVTVLAGVPHFPMGRPYEGFSGWKTDIRDEDGIRVIRSPMIMGSNTQTVRRVLGFLSFTLAALFRLFYMPHQDVIIASVPPATTAIAGIVAAAVKRSRYIVLLRDIEPLRALSQRQSADGLLGRNLIRFFMWIYRRAESVVVVHSSESEILSAHGIPAERVVVIPHGVELAGEAPETETDTVVRIRRAAGRLLAMYVGTIGLVHGLQTLIDSIAHERIRQLPVDFVIIGDGQYLTLCREKIAQMGLCNVQILPSVPLEHVAEFLRQADILICSYRNEDGVPIGSKFYEYCAAGKPILVHGTNVAASLALLIGNGLACEAGKVSDLEAALKDFSARPAFWKESGELGRLYAERHFSQADRNRQWRELVASPHTGVPGGQQIE